MKYKITYTTDKGTSYTEIEDEDDWTDDGICHLECGRWIAPFPNEKGNSMAFGLSEAIAQSDESPKRLRDERIVEIEVMKI
jgi:hypothetical protein